MSQLNWLQLWLAIAPAMPKQNVQALPDSHLYNLPQREDLIFYLLPSFSIVFGSPLYPQQMIRL
jgi:hypothetical protein